MNRRGVLATALLIFSTPFSGCLGENSDDASKSRNRATGENQPDSQRDEDDSEHRLNSAYIENWSSETSLVKLTIRHVDGRTRLSNRYEVPGKTGIEIPEVGKEGEKYDVTARYQGEEETAVWFVRDTCRSEVATTNLAVVTRDERDWKVGIEDCDELSAGIRPELEYHNHTKYILE